MCPCLFFTLQVDTTSADHDCTRLRCRDAVKHFAVWNRGLQQWIIVQDLRRIFRNDWLLMCADSCFSLPNAAWLRSCISDRWRKWLWRFPRWMQHQRGKRGLISSLIQRRLKLALWLSTVVKTEMPRQIVCRLESFEDKAQSCRFSLVHIQVLVFNFFFFNYSPEKNPKRDDISEAAGVKPEEIQTEREDALTERSCFLPSLFPLLLGSTVWLHYMLQDGAPQHHNAATTACVCWL